MVSDNSTLRVIIDSLAGQFPGPTLEARTSDQLVIVVSNQLEDGEGVSFHWHGLHMRGMAPQQSPLFYSVANFETPQMQTTWMASLE